MMRLVALLLVVLAAPALAQDAPALRAHHLNINVGVGLHGGYPVGSSVAELRGNGPGAEPTPFTLFTADSRFTRATMPEVRVGFAVTRHISIEAGASIGHARIGVGIADDRETDSQQLFGEDIQQYLFEGGVTWQLPRPIGRVAPFVSAGGGYLRQLHEERTLAETGRLYYAGGGARYWLKGGGNRSIALGVRGDVRLNLRQNGIDFEDRRRIYPSVSLAMFIGL